jgi:hypothetical protein
MTSQQALDQTFTQLDHILGDLNLHDVRPVARDLQALVLAKLRARDLHAQVAHEHAHSHDRGSMLDPLIHTHQHDHPWGGLTIEHGHGHWDDTIWADGRDPVTEVTS